MKQHGKNNVKETSGENTRAGEKQGGKRISRQGKDKKDKPISKKDIKDKKKKNKEKKQKLQEKCDCINE